MKKTIVISGANGFIGSLLIKKFFDNDFYVVSIINPTDTRNLEYVKSYSNQIIFTDFSSNDFATKIPLKSECFIHLAWAGVNGVDKGNTKIQDNNISMAKTAYLVSTLRNAKMFIGIGTITELSYKISNPNEKNPSYIYGMYKSKCFDELLTLSKRNKTKFLWLRFSNLYGPTNTTGNILDYEIKTILSGGIPEFGPSDQFYDFVYVDDVIDSIYKIVSNNISSSVSNVNVCSGNPRILKDYLEIVKNLICDKATIRIGVKPFDGLIFKKEFFSSKDLSNIIGDLHFREFENAILETINKYKRITGNN